MGEAPEHIVLVETEEDVDAARGRGSGPASPTSPRPRCRSTRRARSSAACASSSRTSSGRAPTTSVTRPRTARTRSSSSPPQCDLVLVIGSRNSSNSNRLVEVAREHGTDGAPDRQRGAGAGGVARRQARRRHHLGRQRARGARAAAGRSSSATAGPRTSPSSRSSRRTCASCCPRRSARSRWPRHRQPARSGGVRLTLDGRPDDGRARCSSGTSPSAPSGCSATARSWRARRTGSSARPTREVVERARRLAASLRELGIGPATASRRSPGTRARHLELYFAVPCMGACCTRSTSACSRTTCATSSATPRTSVIFLDAVAGRRDAAASRASSTRS